jgi:hypothetical protein
LVDEKYFDKSIYSKGSKKLSWAAQDICPGSTATHWDRGAGLNIAIQKILRPFRGSFPEWKPPPCPPLNNSRARRRPPAPTKAAVGFTEIRCTRRLRLEKLLYIELPTSSNRYFKPFLGPVGGLRSETAVIGLYSRIRSESVIIHIYNGYM